MRTLIHQLQKYILTNSRVLPFLLALIALPIVALALIYGTPITIHNPTPGVSERFGESVSIDGNKFVVGAPYDDTGATDAGSAYLFDATTGALLRTFNNPAPAAGDQFGFSVSLYGDKVLIGTTLDNVVYTNSGSTYLFDATTGALLRTFNNPTPGADDYFGHAISLLGDRALISAVWDDTGATDAGSAYLFDATTGALLYTFNNPTPEFYDQFGKSVSLSDDRLLISAYLDNTGALHTGSVYLYDAVTGALSHTFNNPTPEEYDQFGHSVSLSGDRLLVGANADDAGALNAGSAYLFDATTGALLYTFNNPTPEPNETFGEFVYLLGDRALVGSPRENTGATQAGSAYLFDATTGALLQTFNNPTPGVDDSFGISVSLFEGNVLIGAYWDDTGVTDAGSAYLYLDQTDTDSDGIIDNADNCPADANVNQTDTDGDGQGDICDFTPNGDTDGDDVDELVDNCSGVYNPGQEDNDSDGLGNMCDLTPDGDPNPNPTNIDQCKQLSWMDFGFRNQGQCVAFVNTGYDSR
ncbi:MAG: thrombospondin type 3 repeat-containing protein [Patescibacteria group bacterium]